MGLPSKLTEEEEALLAKFALIKKKKKSQSTKTSHVNKSESKPALPLVPLKKKETLLPKSTALKKESHVQPKVPIAPKDAKEKAKQLLASGQLKIGKGTEVRSFKRARVSSNSERKSEATSTSKQQTNNSLSVVNDPDLSDLDEDKEKKVGDSTATNKHSIHNKPYNSDETTDNINKNNNHITDNNNEGSNRFDHQQHHRGRGRGRGRGSWRGRGNYNHHTNNNNNFRQNNLFVSGYGLSKEILERAFAPFGEVKTIHFDQERSQGVVTYFNNESAAAALGALHGEMVEGKTLRVVYSRRRPNDKFDNNRDNNRYTWHAGRKNRPPSESSDRPPRDLDSAPPGEPSKPPRTEERITGKPPEKIERKLVNYNDTLLTYDESGFDF